MDVATDFIAFYSDHLICAHKFLKNLYIYPIHYLKFSGPSKVNSSKLIKTSIERSVEFSQAFYSCRVNMWMVTALSFSQAVWTRSPFRLHQTWKPFCWVEVEMLLSHNPLQTQEILKTKQFNVYLPCRTIISQMKDLNAIDLNKNISHIILYHWTIKYNKIRTLRTHW